MSGDAAVDLETFALGDKYCLGCVKGEGSLDCEQVAIDPQRMPVAIEPDWLNDGNDVASESMPSFWSI